MGDPGTVRGGEAWPATPGRGRSGHCHAL